MQKYQNEADFYIKKMMNYYNVDTISDLANKIHISQPSISLWKKNNYIAAIKKKCTELDIYTEIFDVESDPRSFQIGASSDNSTFFQVAGNNNPKGSGNDLTPQEETLLDYFRKAPEEFKKQILIFALGGKP